MGAAAHDLRGRDTHPPTRTHALTHTHTRERAHARTHVLNVRYMQSNQTIWYSKMRGRQDKLLSCLDIASKIGLFQARVRSIRETSLICQLLYLAGDEVEHMRGRQPGVEANVPAAAAALIDL